ncbi:MAG: YdcF family protein [Candidatus Electronema sp. VV]
MTNCFAGTLTLDAVHKVCEGRFQRGESGGSIGPISSAGLDWCVDLNIGGGLKIAALSGNLHGGLLLFDAKGKLLSLLETPELKEIQLFHLEENSSVPFGLAVTQVDCHGTGVAEYNYHLYKVADGRLKELWKGLSYFLDASDSTKIEERQGFIRFHSPGWGDSYLKLVHITGPMQNGPFIQRVYIYNDGRFLERKFCGHAIACQSSTASMIRIFAFILCVSGFIWLGAGNLQFRQSLRTCQHEAYAVLYSIDPDFSRRCTDGKLLNLYYESVYNSLPSIVLPAFMMMAGATALLFVGKRKNAGPSSTSDMRTGAHLCSHRRLFAAVLLLPLLAVGGAAGMICLHSFKTDHAPGDAAVVLGAAVWGKQPSPVFAERIRHAVALHKAGQVRGHHLHWRARAG